MGWSILYELVSSNRLGAKPSILFEWVENWKSLCQLLWCWPGLGGLDTTRYSKQFCGQKRLCANLIETVDFQVFRTLFMIIPFVVTSWPMPLPRYRADHGGMYPAPLAEISSTSINFMRHMVGPKLWHSTYSTTSGNEDQVFTRLPKFTSIYQQVFTRVQGPIHLLLWCSSRWVDPAIFGTEETIAVNLWGLEVGGAHWWHINHGDSPVGPWITTDVSVCEYSTQRWFVSRCIRVASRRVPPAPSE